MPYIIAATDFSDAGQNATKYAAKLALLLKAELVVIHCYLYPAMLDEVAGNATLINNLQTDAQQEIDRAVAELKAGNAELVVKGEVMFGDVAEAVNDYRRDGDEASLLVIGSSGVETTWPDSAMGDAISNVRMPVLVIPHDFEFVPVRKMCLAADNKLIRDNHTLALVQKVVEMTGAELHVLNVQQDVHDQDNMPDFNEILRDQLKGVHPHYHMMFESNNIENSMADFAQENEIDWMIMIPRHHNFFAGIFHKSHTRTVAAQGRLPILSIHEGR